MHAHVLSDSSLYLAVEVLDLPARARVTRRGLANGDASPLAYRCKCPLEFLTNVYADPPWFTVLQ